MVLVFHGPTFVEMSSYTMYSSRLYLLLRFDRLKFSYDQAEYEHLALKASVSTQITISCHIHAIHASDFGG
jgi:hypothetical protein